MYRTIAALMMLAALISGAASAETDLQALVRDTQVVRSRPGGGLDMVWWIPTEYWRESMQRSGRLSKEQLDSAIKTIDEYFIVAVLEGNISTFGAIEATPPDALFAKTFVTMGAEKLSPIADEKLSADARNFVQMMKPLLANMLGQMGQGMQFVLFENYNAKRQRHIDPLANGFFSVNVGDKEFRWRLPIGSLLPPMFDKTTQEQFPGNYKFSPYSGKPLAASP